MKSVKKLTQQTSAIKLFFSNDYSHFQVEEKSTVERKIIQFTHKTKKTLMQKLDCEAYGGKYFKLFLSSKVFAL